MTQNSNNSIKLINHFKNISMDYRLSEKQIILNFTLKFNITKMHF